ncbi:MAG: carboxypeptidase-like regulatory domain-containing protein [Bacteroidota bacterium]
MFTKHRFIQLLLLTFLLQLTNCGRNQEVTKIIEEPTPPPIELIKASLNGDIRSSNGVPLPNVSISLLQSETTTNQNGYFNLKESLVPKSGTSLVIKHDNYFDEYSLFTTEVGANNYQSITLQPVENSYSFDNSEGFEWSSPQGFSLKINPFTIQDQNGSPVEGKVSIAINWSVIDDQNNLAKVFQNQRAINIESDEIAVQHEIVLQLQLSNSGASNLVVADLQIEMPLATVNLPQPILNEMSSWKLDAQSGFWLESGAISVESETLKSTLPIGNIWSFGHPLNFSTVSGTLLLDNEQSQSKLPFKEIRLYEQGHPSKPTQLFTDHLGRFDLFLPQNKLYRVEVPSSCNQELQIVSPNTWVNPAALASIEVIENEDIATLKKRFVDCEDEPISEGYLLVKENGKVIQTIPLNDLDSGRVYLPVCSSADIKFDLYDQKFGRSWEGLSRTLVLNTFQSVSRLCDTVETYFKLTIGENTFEFANCQASILQDNQQPDNGRLIRLRAFDAPFTSNSDIVDLWIEGDSVGTFNIRSITYKLKAINNNLVTLNTNRINAQATISSVGATNESIEGNIQGTITPIGQGAMTISAQYNALRIN